MTDRKLALLVLLLVTSCKAGADLSSGRPEVAGMTPGDGATGVATNTTIRVTFADDVDRWSVTRATFVVRDGDLKVPGTVLYDGISATFTPVPALGEHRTYEVSLA